MAAKEATHLVSHPPHIIDLPNCFYVNYPGPRTLSFLFLVLHARQRPLRNVQKLIEKKEKHRKRRKIAQFEQRTQKLLTQEMVSDPGWKRVRPTATESSLEHFCSLKYGCQTQHHG
jgi:hypothetical protein